VSWIVEIGNEFEPEFDAMHEEVRMEILALAPPPAVRITLGTTAR
jgi:hypothetical protein